ncbi:MAG: diacylglycerol/lipid kinase family protein [Bacillota bacterium]
MKTLVIVNKTAGHGRATRTWALISPVIRQRGPEYDWAETGSPGHATQLAREAVEQGYQRVIAVGGDGTVHETVNGLARSGVILGVIPAGTGNDFAKGVGLPKAPQEALAAIDSGRVRRIDLARANDRYYMNVAGVGFDAEVAGEANRIPKYIKGAFAYLLGIARVLPRYSPVSLKIDLDGKLVEQPCLLVSAGNGRYYGGGLKICPEAIPDDGLFDVVIGGDFGKLETLAVLPRVFTGTHVTHPRVKTYRAVKVTIESPVPLLVHADGEIVGLTPVTFELIPGALALAGAPA